MLLSPRRLLWGLPVLPLVGWLACTTQGGVAPAVDDAGVGDVRVDSARPFRDSGIPEDAAEDADLTIDRSWLTGEWDPLPNVPRCDILMARHPERDVTPLKWKACGSARAGCSELDVDWTKRAGDKLFVWLKEPVRPAPDGRPMFLFRRWYPSADGSISPEHHMTIAQDLNGPVLLAEAFSLTPGSECFSTSNLSDVGWLHTVYSSKAPKLWYRRSTWAAPLSFAELEVPYQPYGGTPTSTVTNSLQALTFTIKPDGWVLANYQTGSIAKTRLALDDPRDLPDGFLVRSFAAGTPAIYLKNDGTFETYLPAPPGRTVTGYAVDRTQANALVWVEATGLAPSTNPVMYTAPYAATAAGVVPRRVTAYDDPSGFGGGYMIAANGMALNVVSPTRALLTQLSNGDSWIIDAEPGMGIAAPLWVDAQHIWLNSGKLDPNGVSMSEGSVLRIDRSSLGAPIAAH